jgi:hypothetical protein
LELKRLVKLLFAVQKRKLEALVAGCGPRAHLVGHQTVGFRPILPRAINDKGQIVTGKVKTVNKGAEIGWAMTSCFCVPEISRDRVEDAFAMCAQRRRQSTAVVVNVDRRPNIVVDQGQRRG